MPRFSALFAFALALPSFTQQPANSAPQQALSAPTLRTGTRLVVVDVIVTDKNQMPVHGLKAADFALLENNVSQTFRAFEEHLGPDAAHPVGPKMPTLPPGVFTSYQPIPHDTTLNVLLVDRLNTPVEDQLYMEQQINAYLKSAKPGTMTAVFGLTNLLLQIQGFTDDLSVLQAALKTGLPKASSLIENSVGDNGPVAHVSDQVGGILSDMYGEQQAMQSQSVLDLKRFEEEQLSFRKQLQITYTLEGLNQLARYLSNFSGRKNLIWFSGSFPVNVLPQVHTPEEVLNGTATDPFLRIYSAEKEFRQTTALLSRDQVAVYPVLAHGLETDTNFAASASALTARPTPGNYMRDLNNFSQGVYDAHATMRDMAQQTGGQAYMNTNDLAGAVDAAVRNGAEYYTLAYSPTDADWNGNYRRIEVKLRQEGYTLAYRRGYFADDPNAPANVAAAAGSAVNASASSAMRAALIHGGPSMGQIIFTVRIVPNSTSPENSPVGSNTSKDLKGPFRRMNVDVALDPRQMAFSALPDGRQHDSVELQAFLYGQDGKLLSTAGSTSEINLKISLEDVAHRGGLPLHTQISVPEKGRYFLRVAVRDVQADRVGSVEVATAPLLRLPPVPVPGT